MIILILLFSLAFVALFCIDTVSADSSIIYVNDSGGNDSWNGEALVWDGSTILGPKKSIKNATGTVTNGGTVNIANGVYKGVNNTNITIDKNMTIRGQSKDGTIISGNGTSSGIFLIQKGTNVMIQNLTFVNCTTSGAGSIYNNGTLTVSGSAFANNAALGGGAILNGGSLTVTGSTFKGNKASYGGAIYNWQGSLTVTGSTFTSNTATSGGGAISNYGNLKVTGSTFTSNKASSTNGITLGGAILNAGNLTVTSSTFTSNAASSTNSTFGGAIYNYVTRLTVTGSTFTGNTANNGGAICNSGNLTVNNSNFTGNTASGANEDSMGGGAIYNEGTLIVNNGTFTSNKAISTNIIKISYGGGAIWNNYGGTSTVKTSKFTYNTANYGGAISNGGKFTVSGSNFTGNKATSTNKNIAFDGGAVSNCGNLTVNGSNFTGNIADLGGAISNWDSSTTTISGSTFKSNIANSMGGAIYNGGKVTARFCRIVGNKILVYDPASQREVYALEDIYKYGGSADFRYNWWGSNAGPSKGRVVGATVTPWLVLTLSASPTTVKARGTSTITAKLLYDSNGVYHSPTGGHVPDGIPVGFTTKFGTIGSQSTTVNGIAKSTLKAGSTGGVVKVSAKVDSQTVQIPLKVSSTYPKNYATGCSRTATIYIKFSQNIKASTYWSKIYVKNLKTGKKVSIRKWIKGNTLYIKTSLSRRSYNWYQVYIPAYAVKTYSGHKLATRYTFKFRTRR